MRFTNDGGYIKVNGYLERALAISEAELGKEHPAPARSYNNLGSLLQHMGDDTAAKSSLAQALTIFEKSWGATHPSTGTVRRHLAALKRALEQNP